AYGKAVLAGALGERGNDRRMGLIARRVAAVSGGLMLKLIEVAAPLIRNGARIVQVGLVEFFYVRGVRAKKMGIRLEFLFRGHVCFTLRVLHSDDAGLKDLPRHGQTG